MDDLNRLMREVLGKRAALTLYARQWVRGGLAEDAVQEALTALLMQRKRPDDPAAWMFRTVRNAAIDLARSAARREQRERVAASARGEWFEPSPKTPIDAETAEQAIRELPAELRQIVVLRIWGELNFTQIAEIVGLGTSTVHARYSIALGLLRKTLETSWKQTD
jgi:RNA polymerase sigma factor (sigma-70 family)